MSEKLFQKRVEDFTCEHCKAEVKGTGYTNHCTQCLWSKHVDINPGDRKAVETCGGMMKPLRIEGSSGSRGVEEYMIVHECVVCGHTKRNRVSTSDNFDSVLAVIKINAGK